MDGFHQDQSTGKCDKTGETRGRFLTTPGDALEPLEFADGPLDSAAPAIELLREVFGFRDTKDLQFGMGLSATRISEPVRRDRLLLISAFATALLTLLGLVGESLGMDRLLKSNTSTKRIHSLFRQGCMLYDLIPNMPEHRLLPLMQTFNEAVSTARALGAALAQAK